MRMTDLEKVIRAMECCAVGAECDHCPYSSMNQSGHEGCYQMHADALALLKAQEPIAVHVTAEINYRKIGNCPNCGKPINSGDYTNYCRHCGQAVKW